MEEPGYSIAPDDWKPGDKLRCINDHNSAAEIPGNGDGKIRLHLGEIYTIKRLKRKDMHSHSDYVDLEEMGPNWFPSRFEKIYPEQSKYRRIVL